MAVPRAQWTALEKQFDRIVRMSDSKNQVTRINGRTRLAAFVKEHGKEALDAMWERIK